jgi:hypothetical protein
MGEASIDPQAEPPAKTAPTNDAPPPPRLVRVATIALVLMGAVLLGEFALARYAVMPRQVRYTYLGLALALLAATRLRPARRIGVALLFVPFVVGVFLICGFLESLYPRDGTAASRRGLVYDTRTRWEVIHDLRAEGKDAYPSVGPKALMRGNEIGRRVTSPEALFPHIGGALTAPLAGISSVTSVLCNESGTHAIYESDEHGFTNPKGLWIDRGLDVAAIGDSFTQGACLPTEQSIPALLREKYPRTLNLGVSGDGPLAELATLSEYLPPLAPKVVLWFYFNNDLPDLEVEKKSPLLMKYLDDGFHQGLVEKQAKIDAAEKQLLVQVMERSPSWPDRLERMGLTRRSAPMFFQDLVMNDHHSSFAGTLRLDRINSALEGSPIGDPGASDFPLFQGILEKARARVAAWGGTLYFVYLPDLNFLARKAKEHPARDRVLAAAKAAGIAILDLHPTFAALPDLSKVMWHADSHCRAEGYKIIADRVLETIVVPVREPSSP